MTRIPIDPDFILKDKAEDFHKEVMFALGVPQDLVEVEVTEKLMRLSIKRKTEDNNPM